MTDARLCPITDEPLPVTDPGRIASNTACNQLRAATNNLADLMATIDQMIAGAGRKHDSNGNTHVAGPSAPLNLTMLEKADEWRDVIDLWATELLRHAQPGMARRPGDWTSAQAIFNQHAHSCGHWTQQWNGQTQPTGAMCIDEVLDAVRRLEQLANPKEPATNELTTTDALTQLDGISLTIRNACQVITILTGQPLNPSTVRSWEHRGHITANGNPKMYPILDLYRLANISTHEPA